MRYCQRNRCGAVATYKYLRGGVTRYCCERCKCEMAKHDALRAKPAKGPALIFESLE